MADSWEERLSRLEASLGITKKPKSKPSLKPKAKDSNKRKQQSQPTSMDHLTEVQGIKSCIASMKKEIGTLEAELRNYFLQPKNDEDVATSTPTLEIIPESESSIASSKGVHLNTLMNNGDKTLSTHFTSIVYIKSFFIQLVANLSLQVLIFIQDCCLKGVIITRSQGQLALTCSREVYDENCSFDLSYKSEFLVLNFALKLPIFIHLPHILEVQHYDFVFGNRIFLPNNIAYSLWAEKSDLVENSSFLAYSILVENLNFHTWANWFMHTCSHSGLVDFHPYSCVINLDEFQLVLFDPGGTCILRHDIHFHKVFYCSQNPILCSSSSSSFSHYLILMHLWWFSGCRGKVRGRIYLGKVSTSFDIYVLDSRTSLFEDGGNDENMDTASPNLRLNH